MQSSSPSVSLQPNPALARIEEQRAILSDYRALMARFNASGLMSDLQAANDRLADLQAMMMGGGS